jgi:hypothetical protein
MDFILAQQRKKVEMMARRKKSTKKPPEPVKKLAKLMPPPKREKRREVSKTATPGKRKCGTCNELGHNSRTCPNVGKRRCGKCGSYGHNARRCGIIKEEKKPIVKVEVPVFEETEAVEDSNLGNRNYLQPSVKEILEELQHLVSSNEVKKLGRDHRINLEDFQKQRKPNKTMVLKLKEELDPGDLVNERVTLKRNLRNNSFRVPKNILTTDLVQLAMKRGLL